MTKAFICDGARTAIGRYGGGLSSVRADDLAAAPLRALKSRHTHIDWDRIDDIILGCSNQAGEDSRNVARMAALLSRIGQEVPGATINRLCGSGLDAVASAARMVMVGDCDLVIAGGVENMSRAPFVLSKSPSAFARDMKMYDTTIGWRFTNQALEKEYGAHSMPETAENVAEEFSISREDQDKFAHESQTRATLAQKHGRFAKEIIPVSIPQRKKDDITVDQDEHLRLTSIEALSKLRPIVKADGTITAGNASGVNDGAAALLIANEEMVEKYTLTPMARIVATAVAGVAPRIMGIGPAPATEKLLAKTAYKLSDIDIIELNEAFAAQALAVIRKLGLPDDASHVNPNGGAIALGHPLGMSGARLALTAAIELAERDARLAVCTMCVGVGQGISLLIERV